VLGDELKYAVVADVAIGGHLQNARKCPMPGILISEYFIAFIWSGSIWGMVYRL